MTRTAMDLERIRWPTGPAAAPASSTRPAPPARTVWYFRRAFCPDCGAAEPRDLRSAGRGTVHAGTLVQRAPDRRVPRARALPHRAGRHRRGLPHDGARRARPRHRRSRAAAASGRSATGSLPYFEKEADMTDDAKDALRVALAPRSIAVIGASENPNKIGGRPLAYLSRFGFQGAIYPINPNRAEVQGVRCFPSLAALPEAPDVAIVAVPGDRRLPRSTNAPPRREARHRDELGLRRTRRRGQAQGDGAWPRARVPGHAHRRAELAGAGQLRHRRGRQLLDDVHRGAAAGRPGRHHQPERRDERGALRPAARRAASACAIRTPPATTAT